MGDRGRIGPYPLVERVARGGMAEVWRASHPTLDRAVAVKLLRADLTDRPTVRDAFLREVRALSRLCSPQTVQVLDYGVTEDGRPYVVTEFLEGEDLLARIRREGSLPPLEVVGIAIEVLKSLSEAHAQGLVHRDLKPGNVFLQRVPGVDGERTSVKVLDFGIAKFLTGDAGDPEDTVLPGAAIKGSPRYMAPEQIRGEPITPGTDLYSLGAMMYRLIAGEPVFDGDRDDVLRAHLQAQPVPLTERCPLQGVPPALDALVLRCLSKDPADRPASAGAVIEALESIAAEAGGGLSIDVGGRDDVRAPRGARWAGDDEGSAGGDSEGPAWVEHDRSELHWTFASESGGEPADRGAEPSIEVPDVFEEAPAAPPVEASEDWMGRQLDAAAREGAHRGAGESEAVGDAPGSEETGDGHGPGDAGTRPVGSWWDPIEGIVEGSGVGPSGARAGRAASEPAAGVAGSCWGPVEGGEAWGGVAIVERKPSGSEAPAREGEAAGVEYDWWAPADDGAAGPEGAASLCRRATPGMVASTDAQSQAGPSSDPGHGSRDDAAPGGGRERPGARSGAAPVAVDALRDRRQRPSPRSGVAAGSWGVGTVGRARAASRRPTVVWVALGVAVVLVGAAAAWRFLRPGAPPPPPALSPVAAPLPRVAAPAPTSGDETAPAVVRRIQMRVGTRREYTEVAVAAGKARFVRADTGEVLCASAQRCLVPADHPVRVEVKGRPLRTLDAGALWAHRGGKIVVEAAPGNGGSPR